ncbi:hypothetical protein C8F04DRAFT_1177299 [Mycena alexandri]|uniref:Uncharacterized protein n=1 Tax=Mycena alexandri TaxID=1745969 RepID=A0AAD6T763_9AGAR|nr:hypothetical protein C8F04DRAFT_1177299 [Mycena alexandri]
MTLPASGLSSTGGLTAHRESISPTGEHQPYGRQSQLKLSFGPPGDPSGFTVEPLECNSDQRTKMSPIANDVTEFIVKEHVQKTTLEGGYGTARALRERLLYGQSCLREECWDKTRFRDVKATAEGFNLRESTMPSGQAASAIECLTGGSQEDKIRGIIHHRAACLRLP